MEHLKIAIFLASLGALTWGLLHAFDMLRAWRYNRRMAHLRAVAEAYESGKRFAMGAYADSEVRMHTIIVRTTPDRPAPDPWMAMVKEDIEDIFLDLDQPKGSQP